jgi:small-conductance mechanosensitive channel
MEDALFSISGFEVTPFALILCGLVILLAFYIFFRYRNYAFFDEDDSNLSKLHNAGFKSRLALSLVFTTALILLRVLNFDMRIFEVNGFQITVNHIFEILSLFSIALLLDWMISHVVLRNKFRKRETPVRPSFDHQRTNETKATKLVRYVVYLYITQVLLKRLDLDFVLFQREIKSELFTVHLSDILVAIMILMSAKVLVWFITQVTLYRMYKSKDMDEGIQYAINQLVMYVVYVVAFLFALDRIVSDMSIIYGGAAALLVGIGLGLQQTFNDFFSGLVLLFERSVMVGDILEIDGQVGRVLKIGLRASRIETRNSVSMLVPNSKLVNQAVINWTHYDNIVRFHVEISVSYGSDPTLVKQLLLQAADSVHDVMDKPESFVRLNDFGENGLIFTLYFFSTQVMAADNVRSDVRFEIERLFRLNHINIPFPQRVLHTYNDERTKDDIK